MSSAGCVGVGSTTLPHFQMQLLGRVGPPDSAHPPDSPGEAAPGRVGPPTCLSWRGCSLPTRANPAVCCKGLRSVWVVVVGKLHYITLHYITLHYITLHYITLHYITLHYITLHYITLHYITLHYITLHYITLHYITLHYITLHYITCTYLPTYLHTYTNT